ncbi:hypothetical protein KSF_104280 [Reticulibacter mediterranei]|uniref:Uncharacterized protein n=1 Tax=Reticulibacter mediterranei TaxID=2778369 RepID=A0A8J3J136_9CHLR|nr:hypothetical protein KSF_104280 [Reticulibacter mediterranei]
MQTALEADQAAPFMRQGTVYAGAWTPSRFVCKDQQEINKQRCKISIRCYTLANAMCKFSQTTSRSN